MLSYLISLSWYLFPSIAYPLPLTLYRVSHILYLRSLTSPFLYPSPYLLDLGVSSFLLVLIPQLHAAPIS